MQNKNPSSLNILICGESYAGKSTVGRQLAKNLNIKEIGVSDFVGKGSRQHKASKKDKIRKALNNLDDTTRVITGLREVDLLSDLKQPCFIVYLHADADTRMKFFIKREGERSSHLFSEAQMVDAQLGAKNLASVCDLQFVMDDRIHTTDNIVQCLTALFKEHLNV